MKYFFFSFLFISTLLSTFNVLSYMPLQFRSISTNQSTETKRDNILAEINLSLRDGDSRRESALWRALRRFSDDLPVKSINHFRYAIRSGRRAHVRDKTGSLGARRTPLQRLSLQNNVKKSLPASSC